MNYQSSPFGRAGQPLVREDSSFMSKVYGIMGGGLAITAITSLAVAAIPAFTNAIFGNRFIFYGLLILELAMVWLFRPIANRVSATMATLFFLAYAAVNGLTMAVIFLVYTKSSIASTFFGSAAMFGVVSGYGLVTKKDLTGVGSLATMGLIGVLVASLINFFVGSSTLGYIISIVGVAVFVGLTAYDTQRIKELQYLGDTEEGKKGAVNGALILYLDFINLFLMLLRLFGNRRSD